MGSRLNRRTGLAGIGVAAALIVVAVGVGLAVSRPAGPSPSGKPSATESRTAIPSPSDNTHHSPGSFVGSAEMGRIDKNGGWVLGGRRLMMTDDGDIWRDITPSEETGWVESVAFVDETHGWCLSVGIGDLVEGARIFRTVDGGRTWLGTDLPAGRTPVSGILSAVSASTVYVVLTSLGEHSAANPAWRLYVSHDGGANWQWVADPALPGTQPTDSYDLELAFGSERDGLAWGREGMLQSHDGGVTWSLVAIPVPGDGPNYRLWHPVSVRVFGASVVMEVADSGKLSVYDSADAGRTWRLAVDLSSTGDPGRFLWDATDATTSHYYTDGRIATTRDAGRTWTRKPSSPPAVPSAYSHIDAISFADADDGWALVGWQFYCAPTESPCPLWEPGVSLALTEDGGATWRLAGSR